jgi:hypothetical protein
LIFVVDHHRLPGLDGGPFLTYHYLLQLNLYLRNPLLVLLSALLQPLFSHFLLRLILYQLLLHYYAMNRLREGQRLLVYRPVKGLIHVNVLKALGRFFNKRAHSKFPFDSLGMRSRVESQLEHEIRCVVSMLNRLRQIWRVLQQYGLS